MTVDVKSFELAEHFLQGDDEADLTLTERYGRRRRLAEAIQRAVEDWIADEQIPPHRLEA